MGANGRLDRPSWLVVAAPALLLLTPFVIFLRHNAYPLHSAEILGCLLLVGAVGGTLGALSRRFPAVAPLAIASSVVAIVDLQFDVSVPIDGVGETAALIAAVVVLTAVLTWMGPQALTLAGVMAAAVFTTTLATPARPLATEERGSLPGDGQGPFILHLILDEHIGLAGLRAVGSADEALRLRGFLEGEDFLVFDAAYSEHFHTFHSLGHGLNFVTRRYVKELVEEGLPPYTWRLASSRYLAALAKARYAIDVYQTDHLDLCHSTTAVASCHTYAIKGLGVLRGTTLTPTRRGAFVLSVFLARSDIWNEVLEIYDNGRRRVWPTMAVGVSQIRKVSTIAAVSLLERLEHDLRSARRGRAVISHVVLPHAPYVYDAECGMRPPSDWLDHYELPGFGNTPEGRAVRYSQYVGQLECTRRWIQRLLRAIPDDVRRDAIIIVHGDHGSRIRINDQPREPARESDDIDSYSTLFAIRSPGIRSGLDTRQFSISCLLAELVASDFKAPPAGDACQGDPVVLVPVGSTADERCLTCARQPRSLRRFDRWPVVTGE